MGRLRVDNMIKKCCIVTFVYGRKYQCFIPLYILSLFNAYPGYDLRIYVDGKINKKVMSSVRYLQSKFTNFEILSSGDILPELSKKTKHYQQIERSKRWLFYDKAFLDYSGIYIGDIDLLIFKEKQSLFNQHFENCICFKRCFSNISRIGKKKNDNIVSKVKNCLKFGPFYTYKFYKEKNQDIIKYSGLHFVIPNEYFSFINKKRKMFADELNRLAEKKSEKYNLCSFNNEQFLRDIIIDSGLDELPVCESKTYNNETNPKSINFRPHHGIHLGIFRNKQLIKIEEKLINSEYYRDFFNKFLNLMNCDEYLFLKGNFSRFLNKIIHNLLEAYRRF